MPKHQTLLEKIERKKDEAVFLLRELTKLSGEDQVLRLHRTLVGKGRLVRLGYGVHHAVFNSVSLSVSRQT